MNTSHQNVTFKMATNVLVRLCYGPSESYGIIQHQTQRLSGLLQFLTQEKYFVEFITTCHLNRLTVEMFEREIFRCDIRNLQFNMPWENDVVCKRIIDAIKQHEIMFTNPMNMPKFPHIDEGMRWLVFKDILSPQDYFSSDISLIHQIGAPKNSLQSLSLLKDDDQFEADKRSTTDSIVDKQDVTEPQFIFYDIKFPPAERDSEEADTDESAIFLQSQPSGPFDDHTECFGPCETSCPPVSAEAPPPSRESEVEGFRGASLETKPSFSTLSGDYSNKTDWKEKSFNKEVNDEFKNVVRISFVESIQTLVKYDSIPEVNVVNASEDFSSVDENKA